MIGNEVKYLKAIRDCNNITKAAEVLNIAQPSLSRYLKDKEKEIGQELFIREKGKIIGLTDFGKLYFEYADQMVQIEEAYLNSKSIYERYNHKITIAIPYMVAPKCAVFIATVRKLNPDKELEIITDSLSRLEEKYSKKEYDYFVLPSTELNEEDQCIHSIQLSMLVPDTIQEKYKDLITVIDGKKHIDYRVLLNEKFYVSNDDRLVGRIAKGIFDELGCPKDITHWDNSDLAMYMAEKENAICLYTYREENNDKYLFNDENYYCYFLLKKGKNSNKKLIIKP